MSRQIIGNKIYAFVQLMLFRGKNIQTHKREY